MAQNFVHGGFPGLPMYTTCTKCGDFEIFRILQFLVFSATC
jgi:hypothetical protein